MNRDNPIEEKTPEVEQKDKKNDLKKYYEILDNRGPIMPNDFKTAIQMAADNYEDDPEMAARILHLILARTELDVLAVLYDYKGMLKLAEQIGPWAVEKVKELKGDK